MSGSRRIRLRREAYYYLCVLAFILGGAALRQVNLLVILAGLMIAPLIFNWRLVIATIRGLSVSRRLPRRIAAGDLLIVDLAVSNSRRRLDSWMVMVEDTIALEGATGRDGKTKVEVGLAHVGVGDVSRQSYRCHLARRGKYRFGPLKISTRFPLGLVQADVTGREQQALIVCPRLGKLTRAWGMLIESHRSGSQRSQRQRGLVEGEFYGLRDWRPGDTRRWIHWRTSARRRALTVRQFERQRNRDVALVLDLWQPQGAQAVSLEQEDAIELAISFAATAVADLCKRGGSRLAVAVVGKGLIQQTATASQVYMHDVLEQLAVVSGGSSQHLAGAMASVLAGNAPGARTIVISTRPNQSRELAASPEFENRRLAHLLGRCEWIDVARGASELYFHWEAPS